MAEAALQSEYQILFNKAQQAVSVFLSNFEKKAEDTGANSVKKIESSFDTLPTRMNRIFDITFGNVLAGAISKGVAASSSILTNGFDSAINFEKQISSISALTGASIQQIAQIKSVSLKLGKDTKFSALEAAQGFEELLKSGLSLDQVLSGGLAGSLNLAAAGELSVKEASEIASTALNTFSKDQLTVAKAADILAGAANVSATDVASIKFSLAAVGPVAALTGQSFKDTATAIALFANNGLKGSDAGTSLKTLLNNLIPTTKQARQTFKDLGLTTNAVGNNFVNTDGSFKSLRDISEELNKSTSKLSASQKTLALETIFGSDAIRAGAILAKSGAKEFDKLSFAIDKIKAADVAKERLKNLSGIIETLKGTLETLSIEVISPFLPLLTRFGSAFNDALSSINVGDSIITFTGAINNINFEGVILEAQKLGSIFSTLFSNIGNSQIVQISIKNIGAAFAILSQVIPPIVESFNSVFTIFSQNQGLIDSIILGVTSIGSAFVSLAVVSGIIGTIGGIVGLAGSILALFNPITLLIAVIAGFGIAYQTNFGGFADFVNSTLASAQPFFDSLKTTLQSIAIGVLPLFTSTFKLLSGVFQAILPSLVTIVGNIIFFGIQLFTIAQSAITILLPVFNEIIAAIGDLITAITPFVSLIVQGIGTAIGNLLTVFNIVFPLILGVVIRVFEGIGNIIAGIIKVFTGFINIATGIFTGDFSKIIEGFKQIFSGLGSYLLGSIQLITSPFRGAIDGVSNLFKSFDLFQIGVSLVQGLINGIKNNIGSVAGAITGGVSSAVDSVKKFLGIQSPSKLFFEIGGFTGQGLELGIIKSLPKVQSAFESLLNIPTISVPSVDLTELSKASAVKPPDTKDSNGANTTEVNNNNNSKSETNINYGSSSNSFRIKQPAF
jgi:TP901 family phage tail tape measure protein